MLAREKQRDLLLQLREFYPGSATFRSKTNEELHEIAINLKYLEEHGLCISGVNVGLDGHMMLSASCITAAGLDFLEDDGGLSAILAVVTVKLHADTIRDLIGAKIEAAELPPEEKSTLRKRLAALPEAALTEATKNLVRLGLDHLPDGVHWLVRLLS